MKILYEPSRLWETLGGIALVAAAVCMACGAPICKAAKNNLGKNVLAVIGAADTIRGSARFASSIS